MGLDMYLEARRYVGAWRHNGPEERKQARDILRAVDLDEALLCNESPGLTVEVAVGYWRKANHIHKWFVDNVQDGDDDCRSYPVSRDKLRLLLSVCYEAKATKDPNILPGCDGFFFGSTEPDQGYWDDIDYTIKLLKKLLTAPSFADEDYLKGWHFQYQSSW